MEGKTRKNNKGNVENTNNMVGMNLPILIITLNVNALHAPIKRQRLSDKNVDKNVR